MNEAGNLLQTANKEILSYCWGLFPPNKNLLLRTLLSSLWDAYKRYLVKESGKVNSTLPRLPKNNRLTRDFGFMSSYSLSAAPPLNLQYSNLFSFCVPKSLSGLKLRSLHVLPKYCKFKLRTLLPDVFQHWVLLYNDRLDEGTAKLDFCKGTLVPALAL